MKQVADNHEEYRTAWLRYISELENIKHTLPVDHWDELDDNIKNTKRLVHIAADSMVTERMADHQATGGQ